MMMKTDRTQAKPKWKQFFQFIRQAKLCWPLILLALLVNLFYSDIVVLIPNATGALMGGDFSTAALMAVVKTAALSLLLSIATSIISLYAESISLRSLRSVIWKRMMRVETSFYEDNGADQLLSAVTSDAKAAVTNIVFFATATIPTVYRLVKSLKMVSGYSFKLMLAALIVAPVYVVYAIFMGRWTYRTNYRIQARIGGLTGFLSERLRNLPLIKSFATEHAEEKNGQERIQKLYTAKLQNAYINSVNGAYVMLTEAISMAVAVLYTATLVKRGEVTLDQWMAFFMFVPMINGAMRQITMFWSSLKGILGDSARLGRIVSAPQEDESAAGAYQSGDITFHQVSFSYGEKQVLKDVDLTIPRGKSTAVVGLSGGGKTTLVSLIVRLYHPTAGKITLGDIPVEKVNLADYRSHFAYVRQDADVFGGTIREILTYGVKRSVSQEELERALKTVGLYDFVTTQPKSFDTRITAWGASVSGGQRQRLVIARELLKNADVLIFDEPTNALDLETAGEIQRMIFTLFQGKTVIAITHDLSMVANADQIAVVANGGLIGCGTHSNLMEQCPLYQELVEDQSFQEVFER